MRISDIVSADFHLVSTTAGATRPWDGVYCGDLLSVALKSAEQGNLLVTVAANVNAVAVATLADLPAVILCEGRKATPEMIRHADAEGIALLETGKKAAEVVLDLARRGLL